MEGVEDIPGAALAAGIRWGWETFPEFLDFLDEQPLALDVGTQVPHGAVRGYVMGERGARNEPADVRRHRGDGRASCGKASKPARSACRRRAPSPTAPSTASPCPARSRPRTSCSRSGGRSPRSTRVCSSSRRPACWARTSPPPTARWTGCDGSRPEIDRPVTFAMIQHDHGPRPVEADARPRARGPRPRRPDPARRSRAARSGCCSACRRSTRCATARATRRSTASRSTRRWRACAIPRCGPRSWRSPRNPTTSWRSSASGSTASSRSASRPTTSPAPDESIAARAEREGRDPIGSPLRPAARATTAASCCCGRCSGTAASRTTRSARWCMHPATALGLGDGGAHVRRHLRRQHRDVHAHALGARPQPR